MSTKDKVTREVLISWIVNLRTLDDRIRICEYKAREEALDQGKTGKLTWAVRGISNLSTITMIVFFTDVN